MAINISGILKTPQGSAIQNAEIIFEQTRTSTEVLAGTKFSVITNQTGNYSSSLGVGTYVFKVRFQEETQYRTVASNVIVTQAMNNYTLNQIIQDQSQLQDVDYDLLQDVIQARDQAAASAQAAQTSQATATTKASEASSSAQAALASKNAAQTSETNALASKNAAQTSQTNAANSQTAAATSQTTATTKATEASSSAQAALTSKNAAQTSEANALASKNAAQTSQTTATTKASEAAASQTTASTKAGEASASQTQAQQSQSDAGAAASQADTSEQQAQQSQTSASTSQATATTKASEASSSAQAALASKNAAQTSETNALASKNQAQTSQTNAANSQTAAAGSQTTASTKAGEASTSQTNAANSQTTATTKAGEASTSQTNAAASQTTATTKAGEASSSQTAAAGSQSTATTKATESANSAILAQKWAANPENSLVSGGLYSALHYAAKAAQSAQTASGQLVWRGGWSAQAGTTPPTPVGATQDFYRITQAGTILSVQYEVGDYIHWDNINSIWFKMDGTDSVTSVNGRTGAVVVTKTDVGLSAVNNWGASSQTNDASTTTYATTAGVKAAYDLAATKLTATANAVSATKLLTARTINGTNFDGTANITTQNWGTSRNLAIGGTAKAVNGSADVSWTLAEIGAAPVGYGLGVTQIQKVAQDQTEGGFWRDSALNLAGITMPYDGSPSQAFLAVNVSSNTLRFGKRIGATSVAITWFDVYSTNNKPTAADLSVVPDTRTVNGKRLNADINVTSEDVNTYTKQVIDEQSLKTVTIQAPQGVVAGKYYPIVVSNYGSDHSLFVETRSSGGADPMNYCSFDGQVHNGGWSDTGAYIYGQFTIYSAGERQIHSILGSSEAQTAYAIYVEARAFPVSVRVRASANVTCTGLDMQYGTTVFAQAVTNPQSGVGTKTRLLAEFQPGNHFYSSNTIMCRGGIDTQSTVIVNKDRTDVGSLALGGNVQGYAEIAGKAAGQAGYNYDEGLRYYDDNTWRIGSKKILHDGGGTILGQLSTTFNSAAPITLDRGSQVGIGYNYSATQTQYLGVDVAGQLRFGPNLDHSANGYVYTTDRKPTAADVGALQSGATAVAATKLATARTIGGVAFDGTANINLPGVNTAGNQSTTGNAATATKLATARNIAGVSFDGTANISLTAANVGALPIAGGVLTGTGNVLGTLGGFVRSNTADVMSVDGKAYAFLTSPKDTHLCSNQYWDGTTWLKHSNAKVSITQIAKEDGRFLLLGSDAGGTNPMQNTNLEVNASGGLSTRGGYTSLGDRIELQSNQGNLHFWMKSAQGVERALMWHDSASNILNLRVAQGPQFTVYSTGSVKINPVAGNIGYHVGTTIASSGSGVIRGAVEGGSWSTWRERAQGLLVDCQNSSASAHSIWKATNWGVAHIAAMDVHMPANDINQAIVSLHVGSLDNAFIFYANGQLHSNDVYIRSDRRLKSNLTPISSAMSKVRMLTAYTYDKQRSLTDTQLLPHREAGIIAQDLQQVLPEAVSEGTDGILTVSSSAVNALLLEAIKELKAEVDQLRRMINDT